MADFDNDGDIDLVTNNINSPATLYINKTDASANYLKIKFNYTKANAFGIGTKVYAYANGQLQYKELYTVRGFQASSEPFVHFGYANLATLDSLKVVWPNKTYQVLKNIKTNQTLTIRPENTSPYAYKDTAIKKTRFEKEPNNLGINYTHEEDNYTDFNRQKLIPYQVSDRGPALAYGDLNADGKADLYFGSAKFKPAQVFVQTDSVFVPFRLNTIANDSITEDVTAIIADFDQNGKNDLLVGTGGADFFNTMKPLENTYYLQNDSTWTKANFPATYENTAVIAPFDMDKDGDLDVFIGNQMITTDFGKTPKSYLLKNTNGNFAIEENKALTAMGMLTDAIWSDFDGDGVKDLIALFS